MATIYPFIYSGSNPQKSPSFNEIVYELRGQRNENIYRPKTAKPSVVILGAGPAGLIRALMALVNGNEVTVIEKRSNGLEGRPNILFLKSETVDILKKYGVYHYLEEKGALGPGDGVFACSVSIGDLETAMKAAISELAPEEVIIRYETKLDSIQENNKIDLILKTERSGKEKIESVDLLFITEGSKSDTLENHLHSRRIEVLPPISTILKLSKKTYFRVNHLFDGQTLKSKIRFPSSERFLPMENIQYLSICDFSTSISGKLGDTDFYIGGDALFRVDPATGSGCNMAIQSANYLREALNGKDRLNEYREKMSSEITNCFLLAQEFRKKSGIPVDEERYRFALSILRCPGVEKIHSYLGDTLTKLWLEYEPMVMKFFRKISPQVGGLSLTSG